MDWEQFTSSMDQVEPMVCTQQETKQSKIKILNKPVSPLCRHLAHP